jgi:hypothetical protein
MPARRLLRVVTCVTIIALVWMQHGTRRGAWLFGNIAITALLLLVIVMEPKAARHPEATGGAYAIVDTAPQPDRHPASGRGEPESNRPG